MVLGCVVGAYRQVTITDSRGQVLAYADQVTVQTTRRGDGTLGLLGVTFAPGVVDRLAFSVQHLVIASQGVPRLRLGSVRLSLDSGEEPVPSGECVCSAAIGTFRSAAPIRDRARTGDS